MGGSSAGQESNVRSEAESGPSPAAVIFVPGLSSAMGEEPGEPVRFLAFSLTNHLSRLGITVTCEDLKPVSQELGAALRLEGRQRVDFFEFSYAAHLTREYRNLPIGVKIARLLKALTPSVAAVLRPRGAQAAHDAAPRLRRKRLQFSLYFLAIFLVMLLTFAFAVIQVMVSENPAGWEWLVAGGGLVLLLLGVRGSASGADTFAPALLYLARNYRRDALSGALAARLAKLRLSGYSKVYLVAHSFGAVLALDACARTESPEVLLTAGCPFAFFDHYRLYTDRPFQERAAALEIRRWVNLYHQEDTMGTPVENPRVENIAVTYFTPDIPARAFETHNSYWSDESVCLPLLCRVLGLEDG